MIFKFTTWGKRTFRFPATSQEKALELLTTLTKYTKRDIKSVVRDRDAEAKLYRRDMAKMLRFVPMDLNARKP